MGARTRPVKQRGPRDWKRHAKDLIRHHGPGAARWAIDRGKVYVTKWVDNKFKPGGSGGHSMRRSKGRTIRHHGPGSGDQMTSTFSNWHKRKYKLPGRGKYMAPMHLHTACAGYSTCGVGVQGNSMIPLYDGSGTATSGILSLQDVGDMHAQLGLVEWNPVAVTTTNLTRKLIILDIRVKVTLKNMSSIPVDVILYDVVARRDRQTSGFSQPINDWANGIALEDVGVTGSAVANTAISGTRPFQSQLFCQAWKVKKVTRFTLGAGSEHIHYIRARPGYPLSRTYTEAFSVYKGLSTFLMMTVRGGLVHDSLNGTTTGAGAISTIAECNLKYTQVLWNRTGYTNWNNLSGTTAATNNTILEDTDAPAVAATV